MESLLKQWIGFIASLVCQMFSGLYLSFNVYAVPFKIVFALSQTEVELAGSMAVAGTSMTFIGSICYYKYGCRPVYIVGLFLVNTSCILMWIATKYADFFRNWPAFLCIILLLNTSGMVITGHCCMSIGVLCFPKRQALVITVYSSITVGAKIYYSGVYQVFFKDDNDIGGFFLSIGCGFSVSTLLCFCFYCTPVDDCSETTPLQETVATSDNDSSVEDGRFPSESWQIKDILKSYLYHILQWPNVLVLACVLTFMNNLTILSTSVNIEPRELPVYILSCGAVVSKLSFAAVFDYYGTIRAGLILLLVSLLAYSTAMLIGIIHLNASTLYVMTILISITSGPMFSLLLVIQAIVYGANNLFLLVTLLEAASSVAVVIMESLDGSIYDYALGKLKQTDLIACKDCFFWNFVLFFSASMACSIVFLVAIVLIGRKNSIHKRNSANQVLSP